MNVRLFKESDLELARAWHGVPDLKLEIFPAESTYVLEEDGIPALLVCIYYTSCPTLAFMENFCGNPAFKGEKRHEMGHHLLKHCESEAKKRGVTRLIGQSAHPKLTKRWQDLGFVMVIENMSSLVKEI